MSEIASAVDQQAATTNTVAISARNALAKIQSVVEEISAVADDAMGTGAATEELQASSDELSRNCNLLTDETTKFISHIRTDDSATEQDGTKQ